MAKKNKVVLMGFVSEIMEMDGRFMFSLKIRKNPKKFVYPIVELGRDTEHLREQIKVNSLLAITGKVKTDRKEEVYACPNASCNEKIVDKYLFTYVEADKIRFVRAAEKDPFINQIILLGTVCMEKEFKYIEGTRSPLGNTRYQLAVNRREPRESDFPWINSFARQAEEDAKRIQVGSQVLVDGILNTRKSEKERECSLCGSKVVVSEYLTEVVAETVEYLNNCVFGEEEM